MSEPHLAFKIPFRLGMTLYILATNEEIREIPTSEDSHRLEYVEYEGHGTWTIGLKESVYSSAISRYAATPVDAWRLMVDEHSERFRRAQAKFQEDVERCTVILDAYLRSLRTPEGVVSRCPPKGH